MRACRDWTAGGATPNLTPMQDWNEIRAWRKDTRKRLLAERQRLSKEEREHIGEAVRSRVLGILGGRLPRTLGVYWPIQGEMNFIPLAHAVMEAGGSVGLPVVVQKAAPVEFWRWRRGERLVRGAWDIPVPKHRDVLQPELLIVPLVGFDAAGYRLGYGAGFYDRTLAAASPRPRTIAVGFSSAQLDTIHPQPHDIPMDVIVTEHGIVKGESA
jgi:5-formyltetrahydrofolate cyclo-ligase